MLSSSTILELKKTSSSCLVYRNTTKKRCFSASNIDLWHTINLLIFFAIHDPKHGTRFDYLKIMWNIWKDHMKACTDQVKGSNEKNLFLVTERISPYKKISFHPHPNAKPDNDVLLTKFLGCLLSFFETFLNSFVLCIGVMNNWIITYINTPFWNIFPHLYLLFVSSPFWNIEIIFPQQDPKELSPFWCKEHII